MKRLSRNPYWFNVSQASRLRRGLECGREAKFGKRPAFFAIKCFLFGRHAAENFSHMLTLCASVIIQGHFMLQPVGLIVEWLELVVLAASVQVGQ